MSGLGTGMLQDGIFVSGDWIKDAANQDNAAQFLEATSRAGSTAGTTPPSA